LEELVGFRKVIDAISEAKVPIVGHNMYLGELKLTQDLCYFFHNFHKRLPDQVEVFHEQLQTLFPRLYDTKFLAQDNPVIQVKIC
jgi:poly(A)-specific ribonuclease